MSGTDRIVDGGQKSRAHEEEVDPPPSYEAATRNPTNSDHTSHSSPVHLTAEQEKAALSGHYAVDDASHMEFAGPSSTTSFVEFSIVLGAFSRTGRLMSITPNQSLYDISHWQLKFTNAYDGRLARHHEFPERGSGVREIAAVKLPRSKYSGKGPIISFFPHERVHERVGARHATNTDRMMTVSGFVSFEFSLDFPIMPIGVVTWRTEGGNEEDEDDEVDGYRKQEEGRRQPSTVYDVEKVNPADMACGEKASTVSRELGKSPLPSTLFSFESNWSPFPVQHLVENLSGTRLATYVRAAPWSSITGRLRIPRVTCEQTPDVMEAILATCATMVAMQDQLGLMTSYIASAYDTLSMTIKGKGRA